MKTLYPLFVLFFCSSLCANTLPDSIYNYRINDGNEEARLVSKITYSTSSDSKDYSISTYTKKKYEPLQLKYQKEYIYSDCEKDRINFVLNHKFEGGVKSLSQQVSYDYDDQCRRTSTLIEKVSNGELQQITQILSNDFDREGNAGFIQMMCRGEQRRLEAKSQIYKKYSYNKAGQITQMEALHYNTKQELNSSTSTSYTYDKEGRMTGLEVFNNLANSLTEIQTYVYSEGIKVMESYKPKGDIMSLSMLDSTFYDKQNRVLSKRKYRTSKYQDGLHLRTYSINFYSDEEKISSIPKFANVKVKDFGNQHGLISISDLNEEENYTLTIFDVLGRMKASSMITGSETFEMNIQDVTGVLLASLVNEQKEIQTTKFILK